ncbi:iron-containing alcohol dehydrogenase, partial [Oenococcus oeni]
MVERAYDFLMPSVNFFGPGVISKIGERAKMLGMKKPVIVTDKFLENLKNGAVAQTLASLKKSGVDYVVYNEVEPNPKIHNIKEVKTLYEKEDADSIITVGGGS